MDCFFVSCSLKSPDLRGKPVAIAWGGNGNDANGEISSVSYEARKFGIKSGMWLQKARKLCPDLHVLPYEFEQYRTVSEQVYKLFFQLTNRVEVSSCDEAYLDVTDSVDEGQSNMTTGSEYFTKQNQPQNKAASRRRVADLIHELRNKVKRITGGCTCSAGIARNKLLAKMAQITPKRTMEWTLSFRYWQTLGQTSQITNPKVFLQC